MGRYTCNICQSFQVSKLKLLMTHIHTVHGYKQTLYCPIENCFRKFRLYDTLYRHVKKDHHMLYEIASTEDGGLTDYGEIDGITSFSDSEQPSCGVHNDDDSIPAGNTSAADDHCFSAADDNLSSFGGINDQNSDIEKDDVST